MKRTKDKIVSDVRQAREEVWKDYQRDPTAFNQQSEEIRKRLHLKRSKLKPVATTLQEIRERKLRKKIA